MGIACIGQFDKRGLKVDFLAEANHEYRVLAYIPDEREWIWVEDITTLQIAEKPGVAVMGMATASLPGYLDVRVTDVVAGEKAPNVE